MVISIDYENHIAKYLQEYRVSYISSFKKMLKEEVKYIAERFKQDMKGGIKTGRIYPKSNGSGTYRASSPGETPAVDTGNLFRSVKTTSSEGGFSVTAKTNTSYVSDLIKSGRVFFKPFYQQRKSGLAQRVMRGEF